MKQNQYLVPAAILALALVILIVAFKPSKESVSDGMSKETTTLATPSARGDVTAPPTPQEIFISQIAQLNKDRNNSYGLSSGGSELDRKMLPLLAKVTELTEKTVQSQNEAQSAKNQAEQLASRLSAAIQALEISQQEVAKLLKIIQDANDRSIKVGMHIDEAVRKIGSPSEILDHLDMGKSYLRRIKYSLGNLNANGTEGKYSYDNYKYPDTLIIADMASAQRQDPNMNKNDVQAWLIGNQWIFIDENKIITSTGPSQYDFK